MGPYRKQGNHDDGTFTKNDSHKTAPFTITYHFISALTKQRIFKAIRWQLMCIRKNTKISTSELNNCFTHYRKNTTTKANTLKLSISLKFLQWFLHLHSFVIYPNTLKILTRFIENKLRDIYNLHGVPIQFILEKIIEIQLYIVH